MRLYRVVLADLKVSDKKSGSRFWGFWAFLGTPLLFCLYVRGTYWYAASTGRLPYAVLPDWVWYPVFGVCLLSGLGSLQKMLKMETASRILLGLVYFVAMAALLVFLHCRIALENGDSV